MSYTGGSFGTTIEDDYSYDDFMRDMRIACPAVLSLEFYEQTHNEDFKKNAEAALSIDEVRDAFGRMTAYAERNEATLKTLEF